MWNTDGDCNSNVYNNGLSYTDVDMYARNARHTI